MAEAVMSHHWDRTAQLVCLIANALRGEKQRPYEIWEVHPFITEDQFREARPKADFSALKALVPNRGNIIKSDKSR